MASGDQIIARLTASRPNGLNGKPKRYASTVTTAMPSAPLTHGLGHARRVADASEVDPGGHNSLLKFSWKELTAFDVTFSSEIQTSVLEKRWPPAVRRA